jgi:glycosyltransferase involved in cell wall biosynthesis
VGVEKVSLSNVNIGFDAKRIFHNDTGLGNYSRTLVTNLHKFYPQVFNFFLFTPQFYPQTSGRYFLKLKNIQVVLPKGLNVFFWRIFSIVKEFKKKQILLYHGLSNELPIECIKSAKVKWVVSIHDIAFLYNKDDYSLFDRFIHYYKIKYSCRKADLIIAVSEFTKLDICKVLSVSPDKVQVVYQTVHEVFKAKYMKSDIQNVISEYFIPEQFYLFVGSITSRKNLLSALKAWHLLPEKFQLPFVIIGKPNRKYFKQIKAFLANLQKEQIDKILFRNVINEHLPYIFQSASIFIYPSHFEGFGIPVLEALYSGIPVITSNKSSLPEVAGEGAYLVNPDNVMDIREGIIHFMSDNVERQNAINKGFEHIKKFDAQLLTKQLVHLYQGLLN